MAILNIEGFDTYNVVSDTLAGWTSYWGCSFLPQISLPAGRYGGQCMHINAGGGQENIVRNFPWSVNTVTFGFDYRVTGLNVQLFSMGQTASGGIQFYCDIDSTGHVRVYRGLGTTLLGTSTGTPVVAANTWCYIEVGVFVHGSAGTVDVWIDGVNVLHLTGQNTKNLATDQMNQVIIFESGQADWDDMYWADTIATIGPMKVLAIIPQNDQQGTGYTPVGATDMYDCVDELTPDGDTTYITSSNTNDYQTFGYGTLSATQVTAVQLYLVAKKSDPGLRSIGVAATDGTNLESTSGLPLTTSYAPYNGVLNTAPDGTAWTPTKYNAAHLGVKTVI